MNRFWKCWKWILLGIVIALIPILHQSMYFTTQPHSAPPQAQKLSEVAVKANFSKTQKEPIDESTTQNPVALAVQQNQKLPTPSVSTKISKLPLNTSPKLGHFPYAEADQSQLMTISSYAKHEYQRYEKLHSEAALALMKLIYAARDEGVWIIPVSGFRTIANQEKLFQAQIRKTGSEAAAAKISAPSGYSEHHTGYAIDLADGHYPNQDITTDFQQSGAFHWLIQHANEFGFEMSFPPNNPQGVSYEPWHWRFRGSSQARMVFAKVKQVL
jgi:zinc D-Ala-D-Ala carboxypeptidase